MAWSSAAFAREARLADAEAHLHRLRSLPRPEEVPASEARVSEAQAAMVAAEDAYRRTARLAEARTVPDAELISRRAELEQARQRMQVEQARTEIARLTVTSPIAGDILKVDVRAGEHVGTTGSEWLMVLGRVQPLCVRADFDESEIPRFDKRARAHAHPRGESGRSHRLRFLRVEPYVVPKRSLTGDNRERVDTRVLQVVYAVEDDAPGLFVGQQVDVFVDLAGPETGDAGADVRPVNAPDGM